MPALFVSGYVIVIRGVPVDITVAVIVLGYTDVTVAVRYLTVVDHALYVLLHLGR